jgi:two-component system, cell cycle response regulator DivK
VTVRILYIEDDPNNVRIVQKMLKFSGYQVSIAGTGEDGLLQAMQQPPDLILMDINLPGIDGLEATQLLKANPQLNHIPVIALTAKTLMRDRQDALDAGCDGYLPKPISKMELLRAVQQFLTYVHPV